jgi:hypothetical protein
MVLHCRVFSGYIKEVDEKPSSTAWGAKMTFANLMAEFATGGGKQTFLFWLITCKLQSLCMYCA